MEEELEVLAVIFEEGEFESGFEASRNNTVSQVIKPFFSSTKYSIKSSVKPDRRGFTIKVVPEEPSASDPREPRNSSDMFPAAND